MGRLTTDQKNWIAAGHRIRQQWSIMAPLTSGGTSYVSYLFDQSLQRETTNNNRVLRAGSRKVKVWNPHPQVNSRASAPRYQIEVRNDDGLVYAGNGSIWNPIGLYDAEPEECLLSHTVAVAQDPAGVVYSVLGFLSYVGRVIEVVYTDQSTPEGTPDGARAVIRTEQAGAWNVLRRVFDKNDGEALPVDTDGAGDYIEWTEP